MGIGEAIAETLAKEGATVFLFSRSKDKLQTITTRLQDKYPGRNIYFKDGDIQDYKIVSATVDDAIKRMGGIDILINNAGLAVGAPNPFYELSPEQIDQMNGTNISGMMYATHAVLNKAFVPQNSGTILNISSITALIAPPFPGEVVYHADKAAVEGFSNALRNELCGKDIKVLVVRPGPVGNHFHQQRTGYDKDQYDEFFDGYT
ncbi:hypothetical protein FH972_025804 [Carpinus fangiana]|uniref:Uncharacterized protein n=1 Tax=Carpinus fangiana TaxID=176857 RepID=A0A5N6L2C4_9ROSI|nr:hypothetical protein FH972_025804 [Carpinus fangiana]